MVGSVAIKLLLLVTVFTNTEGARILLTSVQFRSHVTTQAAIGGELVKRGHDVYIAVASTLPGQEQLKQIGLQILQYHTPADAITLFGNEMDTFLHSSITDPAYDLPTEAEMISNAVKNDCDLMMSDRQFLDRVKKLSFDLALVEPFVLCPCPLLLPYKLGIDFVSLTVFYFPWSIRIPALPSFYSTPITWVEELEHTTWNHLLRTMEYMALQFIILPRGWNNNLLEKYSPGTASWNDVLLKSELYLVDNDHHMYGIPLPMFPHMVSVPGLTVTAAKPLPDHLQQLFNKSDARVILVSFGSTAHHIPDDIIRQFLHAFSNLKQTVIAKFAIADKTAVPKNVHVMSRLPQNDILGHPRTKLFITHCGNNGLHEALYHGVPVLGFPMFADQTQNCARVCAKGFGRQIIMREVTSAELSRNIEELLNNDSYSRAINRSSAIWRDEPMIGREKAAHWIEHVIKYGGQHLRSPAMDLPLYRFLMLDVLAVLFLLLVAVIATLTSIIVCIVKMVRHTCVHRPSDKKTQ